MQQTAATVDDITDRRRGRLFRRYFLFIMALVCGALLASGAISLYASYQENRAALARLQKEKAVAAAARIEQFIKGIEQQLSFASLPQLGSEGAAQRRIEFLKLLRQAPAVTDIAQLDAQGREVLTVSRLSMDSADANRDRANDPAFLNAKPGKPWIGPVYFRKETEPYFTVGLRTSGGGVTVAEVNLKFVWDVVSRIRVGEAGKAYVVDAKGQLVADPDIGLVLRKTDLSSLAQVKAALGGAGEDEPALLATSLGGSEVLTAWSPIETLGWEVFVEQPVSEVYATLNASIVRTGLLLLAGLVVSAVVSTLLARRMVQPIRELQERAQRIGAGDLDQKIEVHTNDDRQTLAEQFNRMTAQLRESYSGLERKVEERTRELELANQHKSDFLANMSHELRTPLNAVIGFSEVLAEGMFGELNDKQREYVTDIHASGRHLLSLINDILDLSKIEAGRMELELGTFDLPSAIGNAVMLVRERAQRHGIELAENVEPGLGEFSGDERKFKQIMLNLLSNAVKFTGDGGRVTVAARRDGDAIEVSVADTGIGIAPEDQPRVFEEFVQVGSDYATKREGTGLGLPLAKRFVELHGGRMWLTSEPGRGSTFCFSLPIRAEAHA